MKIKLHFNRPNMQQGKREVWTAHTYQACNQGEEITIRHGAVEIGRTVFNPEADQPRAFVEFHGKVLHENGRTIIQIG